MHSVYLVLMHYFASVSLSNPLCILIPCGALWPPGLIGLRQFVLKTLVVYFKETVCLKIDQKYSFYFKY